MYKKFLLLSLLATLTLVTQGRVRLPHLLADNMILQQNTQARLWGWDAPGRKVTVSVSWSKQKYSASADASGRWALTVPTPAASYTPLTITFDDGEKTVLRNVLSGEVWVCAGQSNMEMPMRGFGNCPVEGYNDEMLDARHYGAIHYVKIPSTQSMRPLDDAECRWDAVSAATLGDCSATGYFFAQAVNQALDIPVGLIMANKGGSRVESWLDEANLRAYTGEPLDSAGIAGKYPTDYLRPLVWGNGTFAPILNYTVKGILFYQGCSNVGDPAGQYTRRLELLVKQWRRDFRQGDIPFYFVQIAPYINGNPDGDWGPRLREQQFVASKTIPNSGIVCTQDLVYPYEIDQIHPCQKRQVGRRLALLALNEQYGMKELQCQSPEFKRMEVVADTCYVWLDHTYGGINRYTGIEGFEVAGADHVFHPARAGHFWKPDGGRLNETIWVHSDSVARPVAVRYCFRNFQLGTLGSQAGLPLFPFRTDNW